MEHNGLKMPDDYTELNYEDGELSGSGHRRFTKVDALLTGLSVTALGALQVFCTIVIRDCCRGEEDFDQMIYDRAYGSASTGPGENNDQNMDNEPGAGNVPETLIFEK